MMKLIALTGGLQLLTQLNLTGTVITDCQSLTRKLQMSSADLPYSSDTMGQMAPGAAPDPSLWMVPHIWGNFLAVRYAGTPNAPPPLAFPSFVALPPLPYHEISEAAIRTTDWHFAHRHHYDVEHPDSNPGLSHLPRRLAALTHDGRTPPFYNLRARGMGKCGSKIRHLWDLRWHGENQAIPNQVSRTISLPAHSVDTHAAHKLISSLSVPG